ncbi:2,3-bisphosphoglycerate-independent phosphoglycerate mutase [Halorussus gelatinilyticus]|uniref:2,3-bisphosphoglycerate-independent phosphoglycerate mutase n=1 Tax=Halorussus gelatinilyticus TaxID=2937524 RepID=A0A8U0ILS2_9EURY|nr:2,3-bisphosphoglycerate-independent phosphoglycerate mutase [Halorussus gelatinilyticus]UPW00979.1 2,3-bisphosphoglycerate-independent phosphoglycerate mutase [Halorussus gelatinilyticus]
MKAALIVLDGWGLGSEDGGRNAIEAADTPNFDRYAEAGAYGTLNVTGRRVGLPEGQMGNSEVGHLNIGAGRVVKQEYTRIEDAIENGELGDNEAIASAFDYARENDGRVHFTGLVSEGGVHSDQRHLYALIELAAERGVDAVTHAFTDGRDTPPRSGAEFLGDLQSVIDREGTGDVATVSGRYYAMDRDQNWERTKRAYDAIVNREADHEAESAVEAVERSYERDTTDEFVEPTLVAGGTAMEDGDAAVFFNFRADRARQLTRMLAGSEAQHASDGQAAEPRDDIDSVWEFDTSPPEILLATMTQYDAEFDLPVAFPPHQPADTLGEVLAENGLTQLRIAESEKYAHVTYFLNGGREVEFDGEVRKIVESPDVPTYDQRPEMSAEGVTDTAIETIESDDPDVLVLNYANPDMVGHTGDFDAAVEAVEAVDEQLGRLVAAVEAAGGHALVTADHGNADDMGTPEDPHTAHTYNLVPLVYLSPENDSAGKRVREGGSLCDVAPTLLSLIGVDQPEAMTGRNLLE